MRIYMVRQFIWFKKEFEVEGCFLTRQGRRDDAVSRSGCNENKVAGFNAARPALLCWGCFGEN